MNIEPQIVEVRQSVETTTYRFVVDAELAEVGGGSALIDY